MSITTNLTPNANTGSTKSLHGRYGKILITLAALMLIACFTATPAAIFAIELYQKHRPTTTTAAHTACSMAARPVPSTASTLSRSTGS